VAKFPDMQTFGGIVRSVRTYGEYLILESYGTCVLLFWRTFCTWNVRCHFRSRFIVVSFV